VGGSTVKRSHYAALICIAGLVGFAAGCSDDDDPSGPPPLNAGTVASALNAVIPAAVQFPFGVAELLAALAPPTRGVACTPIDLCATSGMAEACPTAMSGVSEWTFTDCVDDEMTTINGIVTVTESGSMATVDFGTGGFAIGGDPVTGQMIVTNLSAVQFNDLGVTLDGSSLTLNGGTLTIDIMNGTAAGQFDLAISSSAFPPFSGSVSMSTVNAVATMTDPSTAPPTIYSCTGPVSSSNGDITVDLTCDVV
jgi:hypothetical protein